MAAVQVALMSQEPGDRPRTSQETYAKIKYDRQIAAIAKVQGASVVYSDDANVRGSYAKRLGMMAVALADLPLPPPPKTGGPDLLTVLEEELAKQRAESAASERASSIPAENNPAPEVAPPSPPDPSPPPKEET
jgi:hypothetical protein